MDHSAEASTHTAEVYMQPGDQQPPCQLGQTAASWTRHTKLGAVQVIPDWGPECPGKAGESTSLHWTSMRTGDGPDTRPPCELEMGLTLDLHVNLLKCELFSRKGNTSFPPEVAHLQFTWRPSAGPISSSHGGPVQGPSPVRMEVQCRAHLQFTWRSSAGPISSIRCKAHSTAGGCQPELYHRGTRLEGRGQHTSCLHPGWTLIYAGPMQTARA